jgi:hypothetical protein
VAIAAEHDCVVGVGRASLQEARARRGVAVPGVEVQVDRVLETVSRVSKEIDTVVAVGVSTRCEEDGEDPLLAPLLEELGYTFERAKTNMGLGRVTNVQKAEGIGDQHLASVR